MDKKEIVDQYLLQNGFIKEEAMQEELHRMAEQCPPATAAEKGLTTDYDKAYETYLILTKQQTVGGAPAAAMNPATTMAAVSQPTSTATAAETAAVSAAILNSFQDKLTAGMNSKIQLYLLGRPAPSAYIPEGTTGVIKAESWNKSIQSKIDSGAYRVLDDYTKDGKVIKSKSNYEALKAAVENGTPVAVHVGPLGTRPVGYVLNLGATGADGSSVQTVTRQEAQQILTWKVNGYLGEENGAALRLKTVASRTDKNNPGRAQAMKTVMVDVNKKTKIESGAYEAVREVSETRKPMTLKTELSFKVEDTTKMTGAQKHPTRVIRASVTVELPTLRLVDKYAEKFQKKGVDLSIPPTSAEDMVLMSQVIAAARLEATSREADKQILLLNPEFKAEVEQMQKAMTTQSPSGVTL